MTIDWNIMARKKKLTVIKFKRKTRDMSQTKPRQVRLACPTLALNQTQVTKPSHYLPFFFLFALLIMFCVTLLVGQLFTQVMPLVQATNSGLSVNNIGQSNVVGMRSGRVADFSLAGELRQQVALPCLVGRASLCGLPYLIVWYKFSLASNSWVRLESSGRTNSGSSSRICKATSLQRQDECVQFDISSVQLTDEGDYKCQVTYAEDSLDSDSNKCPASTITQLFVVAKPSAPAVFVNGRLLGFGTQSGSAHSSSEASASLSDTIPLSIGSTVRLECQSSGGRPAPRIEWLNVSRALPATPSTGSTTSLSSTPVMPAFASAFGNSKETNEDTSRFGRLTLPAAPLPPPPIVTPLRQQWPVKSASGVGSELVSSAIASITLSRADWRTEFVCVVAPAPFVKFAAGGGATPSGPSSPGGALAASLPDSQATMLRRVKLNVVAKPLGTSINVFESPDSSIVNSKNKAWRRLASSADGRGEFISVKSESVHKLTAIKCVASDALPAVNVEWFSGKQCNRRLPTTGDSQVQQANVSSLPMAAIGDFELPIVSQTSAEKLRLLVDEQQKPISISTVHRGVGEGESTSAILILPSNLASKSRQVRQSESLVNSDSSSYSDFLASSNDLQDSRGNEETQVEDETSEQQNNSIQFTFCCKLSTVDNSTFSKLLVARIHISAPSDQSTHSTSNNQLSIDLSNMLRHKIASPTNLVSSNQTSSQQQQTLLLLALNESQAMQLVSLVENSSDETFLDCLVNKKAKLQQTNPNFSWTMTSDAFGSSVSLGAQHKLSFADLAKILTPSTHNSFNQSNRFLSLLGTYACKSDNFSAMIKLQLSAKPQCLAAIGQQQIVVGNSGDLSTINSRPVCRVFAQPQATQFEWQLLSAEGGEDSRTQADSIPIPIVVKSVEGRPPTSQVYFNASLPPIQSQLAPSDLLLRSLSSRRPLSCRARNSMGVSENCLSTATITTTLSSSTFKAANQWPAHSKLATGLIAGQDLQMATSDATTKLFQAGHAHIDQPQLNEQLGGQLPLSLSQLFASHYAQLLSVCFAFFALTWLGIVGVASARRQRLAHCSPSQTSNHFNGSKQTNGWRLARSDNSPSTCYYGTTINANLQTDSERELARSCSQVSSSNYNDHYDNNNQQQQQHQQQQHQHQQQLATLARLSDFSSNLGFNGTPVSSFDSSNATLVRDSRVQRHLAMTMRTNNKAEANYANLAAKAKEMQQQQQQQQLRYQPNSTFSPGQLVADFGNGNGMMKTNRTNNTNKPANSSINAGKLQTDPQLSCMTTTTSNTPLIANSSKVNIDQSPYEQQLQMQKYHQYQQQQRQRHFQQPTIYRSSQEDSSNAIPRHNNNNNNNNNSGIIDGHIYDDVIYKQIGL